MQFIGIIPARYASTRFPGKPLVEINGISMIRRVYEQACKCSALNHVLVATDDKRIYEHVETFGRVVYTSDQHLSGTDRCFEAAEKQQDEWKIEPDDVIVNIQGDEPFIKPEQIDSICEAFERPETLIATLIKKVSSGGSLFDPNVVKVVADCEGIALYFSRSPIPFFRDRQKENWTEEGVFYRHIGMYAYRMEVLSQITKLPVSSLEKTESLEQLRWLENGFRIQTRITELESLSVDTPSDLEKLKGY